MDNYFYFLSKLNSNNENATQRDIENACKLANIDDFINRLPNKYD